VAREGDGSPSFGNAVRARARGVGRHIASRYIRRLALSSRCVLGRQALLVQKGCSTPLMLEVWLIGARRATRIEAWPRGHERATRFTS
jgi:hypothetical protein